MSEEEYSEAFAIIAALILAIVFTLIVAGNVFVLFILWKVDDTAFNDITKLFLRSLTISDLLVGIFMVLPNIGKWANGGHWPYFYGPHFQLFYLKSHIFILISGLLSLLVITVERYVAVSWALRYATWMTQKKARIVVAIVWLVSMLFAISAQDSGDELSKIASFDNINETQREFISSSEHGDAMKQDGDSNKESTASLWLNFFLLIALPIITIIILSVKLYAIARQHRRRINEQQRQFVVVKNDFKGAVTFFIVAGAFAVAWLPNFVLSLYKQYTNTQLSPELNYFVRLIIYCNSWWNVCIYYLRNRSFRRATKRLLGLKDSRWFTSNSVGDTSAATKRASTAGNEDCNSTRNEMVPSIEIT